MILPTGTCYVCPALHYERSYTQTLINTVEHTTEPIVIWAFIKTAHIYDMVGGGIKKEALEHIIIKEIVQKGKKKHSLKRQGNLITFKRHSKHLSSYYFVLSDATYALHPHSYDW